MEAKLLGLGSKSVTLLTFNKKDYSFRGQQLAGSLAGAAPGRKDIDRAQRQAHPGWKSGEECKSKSLLDCFPKNKESRGESRV